MPSSKLTPLQLRILEVLAGLEPAWTLTGGAALVGFHLGHRSTRDLDLFLHEQSTLGDTARRVLERLGGAGLTGNTVQSGAAFHRILVTRGTESTLVDLVADPVVPIEPPARVALGPCEIQIDTPHEILVNKLCALVQRSELRDLQDVRELLLRGGDFPRALRDAPRKDGGFSPLTLGWTLRELPLSAAARAEGWSAARIEELDRYRSELLEELARLTRPSIG
jgi:hypothetical protein